MLTLSVMPSAYAKSAKNAKSKKVSKAYIEEAIVHASQKTGVPADLLRAICTIESNLTVDAFVHDDGGNGNHAYGMCQVLRETAEKYVGKDKNCEQDFRNMERSYATCKLFGPKVNALAAAHYLKDQLKRYQGNLIKATAAFNSGSVKQCSKKGWVTNKQGKQIQKCKPGGLLNSYYVKRIEVVLTKAESDMKHEFADVDLVFSANKG